MKYTLILSLFMSSVFVYGQELLTRNNDHGPRKPTSSKFERPMSEGWIGTALKKFYDTNDLNSLSPLELRKLSRELELDQERMASQAAENYFSVSGKKMARKQVASGYGYAIRKVRAALKNKPLYQKAIELEGRKDREAPLEELKFTREKYLEFWKVIAGSQEFSNLDRVLREKLLPSSLRELRDSLRKELSKTTHPDGKKISDELSLIGQLGPDAFNEIWESEERDTSETSGDEKIGDYLAKHPDSKQAIEQALFLARKVYIESSLKDRNGNDVDPSIRKRERPWLWGDHTYFEPVVRQEGNGEVHLTFAPTEELKRLQLKQAIWFGTTEFHSMEVSSPKQKVPFTLAKSQDERALQWHLLGSKEPISLAQHFSGGGLKPSLGPIDIGAAAATGIIAGPTALTLSGVLSILARGGGSATITTIAQQPIMDELNKPNSTPRPYHPNVQLDTPKATSITARWKLPNLGDTIGSSSSKIK